MKRTLSVIAGLSVLAATLGVATAHAQSYRRSGARVYAPQAYTSQNRGPARREGGSRTPFSDPNSPEATGGGSLGYNRTVPHW